MALRDRGGMWHYRFFAAGRSWTASTELAATERNRSAALLVEAEARRLVKQGKGDQLRLEIKPFSDAADEFVQWCRGEYRAHPNSWKRIRGSMTSAKQFFGFEPLHSLSVGRIQDYMAFRRLCPECSGDGCEACDQTGEGVREITLRHDLHALSLLFQYGETHHWSTSNPVRKVKIPSDAEAVRIHVLSTEEERAYFAAAAKYPELHDVGRIMILQGARPSEVMQARAEHIDVERGTWAIPKSKSNAGKRTLRLLQEAKSIMARRKAAAGRSGWLFEGRKKGTHLRDVENSHQAVLEDTGLAFVLYDLRHTCATRWSERGMGIETIAKLLGHANLRSVMRYVHLSQAHCDAELLRCGEPMPKLPEETLEQPKEQKRETVN